MKKERKGISSRIFKRQLSPLFLIFCIYQYYSLQELSFFLKTWSGNCILFSYNFSTEYYIRRQGLEVFCSLSLIQKIMLKCCDVPSRILFSWECYGHTVPPFPPITHLLVSVILTADNIVPWFITSKLA